MITQAKYTGTTPGADAADYILFDSVTAFPGARLAAMSGIKRINTSIKNDQAGTLKLYRSGSRVANPGLTTSQVVWHEVYELAIAAAAANASTLNDFLVETYPDFKVVWTNGGAAQGTWDIDIVLDTDRGPAV